MTPTDRMRSVCATCGKPATCVGAYEGATEEAPSCDDCCGHGCEDGKCRPLAGTEGDSADAPTPDDDRGWSLDVGYVHSLIDRFPAVGTESPGGVPSAPLTAPTPAVPDTFAEYAARVGPLPTTAMAGGDPTVELGASGEPAVTAEERARPWVEFEWDSEEPCCVRCGVPMLLRDGCEWSDDHSFNLCRDCESTVLRSTLDALEAAERERDSLRILVERGDRSRADALARLERAEAERDTLKARLDEIEAAFDMARVNGEAIVARWKRRYDESDFDERYANSKGESGAREVLNEIVDAVKNGGR